MAQKSFDYNKAWHEADSLVQKGLPKSAIALVDKIYARAKKDQQQPQLIKAVVVKSYLLKELDENAWKKSVAALENETRTAAEPIKQILQSITADLYWDYFQQQRWKIYNRTATVNFKKADPDTWSIDNFHHHISQLFQASLQNAPMLQKQKVESFDPVILKGNSRSLRPSMYDLLAHKALEYFENSESDITKPAYAFELNDFASLAAAKQFLRYEYKTRDSSSHLLHAIRIYQDLIRFHLTDDNPDALIDADLQRLEFAKSNSKAPYKDRQYRETIELIYSQYKNNEQGARAGYLLAEWWKDKGDNYNAATGNIEDRMAYIQAIRLANEVKEKFPKSEAGANASNLLNELEKPSLYLQLERVNTINQSFRALIQFKLAANAHFRIIALKNTNEADDEGPYGNRFWEKLVNEKPMKQWTQPLPQTNDARQHSVEVKVDGLPPGRYILLASSDSNFSLDRNPLAASKFYVSNIGYVQDGDDYFVVDRINGSPIANASVQVWNYAYDYNERKYNYTKGKAYSTNKQGYFKLVETGNKGSGNLLLQIKTANDELFLDEAVSNYYRYFDPQDKTPADEDLDSWHKKNARYFIFTDRSLYRPGQTLYFKAIGISKDKTTRKPIVYQPGSKQEVLIFDANNQQIDSISLQPNEYGSIEGKFTLPVGKLTGQYRIEVKGPNEVHPHYFRIEEYKRPKFSVGFNLVKGTYRLNDTVTVTGNAKAYAGNTIDNANVTYHVYRQTRFLYPWMFWSKGGIWPPFGERERMEITNGTTQTKTDGSFNISFNALPDLSIDKKLSPAFDFVVEAQVTDLNGESHSNTTIVSIGYQSMFLTAFVNDGMYHATDSIISVNIGSANLQGEAIPATVEWKLYQLQTPQRLLRKRYWQAPDTTVMSRDEFEQYFPNDPYQNEDDYRLWNKGKTILQDTLKSDSQNKIVIDRGSLAPGYYLLEATATDKNGQPVKTVAHLAVYDFQKGILPAPSYLLEKTLKGKAEPGSTVQFLQGSSVANLHLLQQVVKPDADGNEKAENFEWIDMPAGLKVSGFPVTETDRGGYTIRRFFVQHNRFYSIGWQANVPWTNKQLSISFETFRHKLLPGQQETWKVKIKGPKGDKVAAEMLASMYDASLDQIYGHQWSAFFPWNSYFFGNSWSGSSNFSLQIGNNKTFHDAYQSYSKNYDELISVERGHLAGERMFGALAGRVPGVQMVESAAVAKEEYNKAFSADAEKVGVPAPYKTAPVLDSAKGAEPAQEKQENIPVQVRKNFNETAFFFPDLTTDDSGNISFSFTMPEALTQWKLQLLAHSRELQTATATASIVTQKELMVQPNAPRFFRQGDKLEFSAKVVNLSDKELTGTATLELLNATTMQPVDGWLQNVFPQQYFTAPSGQSVAVNFPIEIPVQYTDALVYRITAKAGNLGDGEEMALPVLSNRILVTESFPINMRGTNSKSFSWQKLLESDNSPTLQHQSLTIEYSSNPVWLAIQALPYLMEYPYDCAEQTWNRFYANAMATHIANSMPKVKTVLAQWKGKDTATLISNLQKNEQLKQALLEETPWVLAAKTETEKQKNIALLFDVLRMQQESEKALAALEQLQSVNGGFVWFKGGPDDRYMTQYILSGVGHLKKLKAWPAAFGQRLQTIANKGVAYLDARMKEDYDRLQKTMTGTAQYSISSLAVQYLYMRSFFPDVVMNNTFKKSYQFYFDKAKTNWLKTGKQQQAMIAIVMQRSNLPDLSKAIIKSLTETSITHEEFGMYWKEFNNPSYYWWQSPIESHAVLLEAFAEVENNTRRINDLKTWLLKQKQTTSWESTRATAEACYALLMTGSNWINAEQTVSIKAGNWQVNSNDAEAGTGYFSSTVSNEKIQSGMGKISIEVRPVNKVEASGLSSWGAAYWQYFEELDKIQPAATPLRIEKTMMLQTMSDAGMKLAPITNTTFLRPGNKITVRLAINSDRQLEYVHLKDMRAACLEPTEQLSGYRWQEGLGYYQAPKDASMHFFISYLPKGTYVLEYSVVVTHTGSFNNGISTIQCMYAPEFSAHSGGQRIEVKNQ